MDICIENDVYMYIYKYTHTVCMYNICIYIYNIYKYNTWTCLSWGVRKEHCKKKRWQIPQM
jgi:hypothetical protein